MRPVGDMLGQFFSGRKGANAHPSSTPTLDSATEESHTRHLLYPDTSTLCHPDGQPYPLHGAALSLGTAHDGPLPEIDLEFPRDCRILIAQDESKSTHKTLLFDSKPGPLRAESPTQPATRSRAFGGLGGTSTTGPSLGGMHARRASLVTESTPRSPTVAAFARSRTRGNSISSMPNIDEHAQTQAKAQAKSKESTDLVNAALECMFGNTPMNYRGNSNKIHIVPLESKPADPTAAIPPLQDGTSSLGRSAGLRQRSNLAKSFTPGNIPPELAVGESSGVTPKESRRRTIFITRMFSVTMPDDEQDTSNVRTPTPQSSVGTGNGFPFPSPTARGPQKLPPSRKSPMYAITIILHLPIGAPSSTLRPPSRPGQYKTQHLSTSAPGNDSLGSSLDSDRRAGWSWVDGNFGVDSLLSMALSSDVDDRVDVVGQHWDVIMRTLTSLQFVVQEKILAYLKTAQATAVPLLHQPRVQPSRSSLRSTTSLPARRVVALQPNALMFDADIKKAVDLAGSRVVSGMRIPRVLTGQGKWGVWREEARWLGRWAGGKEENFFFFILLTAFLGNHTEWLNVLGPKLHRRRHREQHKVNAGDNLIIPNRTVIVSPDKMAARRLIFLLAAFLPPNASSSYDVSPMRPSTSASLRGYSQSPPTNMPPSRKHSLRRQINRRPRGKDSQINIRLQPPTADDIGPGNLESLDKSTESGVTEFPEMPRHSRRSSAHSIRTSLVMPSMSDTAALAKSTSAAVSTGAPHNDAPVPHFALPRTKSGPMPDYRPESNDSLASANLMNTLQRSSTGHASNPSTESGNSRWSGFMSFWGGRRGSSTDQSDYLQTTDDGLGVAGSGYRSQERPRSQLEQMVQELSMDGVFGESDPFDPSASNPGTTGEDSPETYPVGSSGVPASAARPIPERPKTFDTALKLSVNEKDGVIDVDIPLPDFGSPLQSPLLGGYGSVPSQQGSSYGESSVLSMPYCEPEQSVNAAGWLKQFHPDFAVQAIRPYHELERDIKWAMSAEPSPITSAATPTLEQGPLERWVDVCSALIADTRTFSIKRISLRRLIRLIPTPTYQASAMTPGVSGMPPGRSQYGNPYNTGAAAPMMTEMHLAEKFVEEQIMDFDATLIDAVDRCLAQSGQGSRAQSASSSRSSSRRGRRDSRPVTDAPPHVEVPQTDCKAVIFDALEIVVKNVTAERETKQVANDETVTERKGRGDTARTATDSSLKEGIRRWLTEVE
ncbi:hypothetical protein DPSP01_001780 [Paraphaeosphaeria sporulosa]|uniref:Folliculin-interacting protein N-terminal domain-containing protein n=1 Tax=Paraphaeosphaeria sporulosa TaxID=1460663 RepID=A0A177CSG6_9PLEO|nr:uncharacterized protein CC84DRAFT_1112376 [Paraphaeosphaeria sporulosa]OAG10246.1 hypothetical protein CC84DRAFT_1112376 [Paraphaeosphaeria sporulosa]